MDRKNLNFVFDEYVSRFDELDDKQTNNEGYKWYAVTWFKQHWNLDVDNVAFAEMFTTAMKETSVLIDGAQAYPTSGIKTLLKHEEEIDYVRDCFKNLFSEDDGDLEKRQERIEIFMEKINGRIEKYFENPKQYQQGMNHVISYLNLWKPEENYFYKYTEATAWADCIEYGDDFGSGSAFSLAKYYKMCDELLKEVQENEDILNLIEKRVQREVKGFDDQLHIAVYDIMFCANAYGFYNKMEIDKGPARKRVERAKIRAEKSELDEQISEIQNQLQALSNIDNVFRDMRGMTVKHKKFGVGTVISSEGNTICVAFGANEKKLGHPISFINGFLSIEDAAVLKEITLAVDGMKQKEALERELRNIMMKRAALD